MGCEGGSSFTGSVIRCRRGGDLDEYDEMSEAVDLDEAYSDGLVPPLPTGCSWGEAVGLFDVTPNLGSMGSNRWPSLAAH